jgi:hypothetical protein
MIRRADSSGLVVRRMGALRPALTWPPKQAAPTWRVSKKNDSQVRSCFSIGRAAAQRQETHARGSPGRCPVQVLRYDA